MAETATDCYEFGPYRLEIRARRLSRDGELLPLAPKDFETLLLLVINRNRVVTKAELMKALWPESFVEEANLTQHIFTLRKALGDQSDGKPYIDNIPRRGYRFTAPVREGGEKSAGGPLPSIWRGRRMAAYATLAAGALTAVLYAAWRNLPASAESPGSQSYRSIAVLPFRPLSPDSSAQDLLGRGLADALISRLSNISEITVRPTGAVQLYTKPGEEPAAVGRALRVDAVLDGTIQQSGDQIRVSVKLISAKTGAPVWNETYDAQWTDLFMVQDAIVGRVATTMLLKPRAAGRGRDTRGR